MIEARIAPIARIVTVRALPAVVVALAVTRKAVIQPAMAEIDLVPVGGVVTVGTPVLPVTGGLLVALQTVSRPRMIEDDRLPVLGGVTG